MPIDAGGGRVLYRRPAVQRKRRKQPNHQPQPRPQNRGIPVGLGPKPFERAQQQAHKRVQRAQARLPKQPKRSPSLPPRVAPSKSPVFGGLQRADQPIIRAHRQAARQVKQAEARKPAVQAERQAPKNLPPSMARLRKAALTQALSNVPLAGRRQPLQPVKPKGGGLGGLIGSAAIKAVPNAIPALGTALQVPVVGPALRGLASATAEHPLKVGGNTALGAVNIAEATPAAIAQLAVGVGGPLVTGHPGRAASNLAKVGESIGADYARRYGPLLHGQKGYEEYKQRILKEGAAPELLDAATVLSGGGAITGRALGAAARSGALGERLGRLATEARPALKLSGDLSRPQELSPNLFKAAGQKAHDTLRVKTLDRRTRKAAEREARGGDEASSYLPLQPDRGQVRPISRRLEAREQRKAVSRVQSRAYLAQRREFDQEVRRGLHQEVASLPARERKAAVHAAQGLLPVGEHVTPDAIRAVTHMRRRQIIGQRDATIIGRALRREGATAHEAHTGAEAVRRARIDGSGAPGADGLVADLEHAGADRHIVDVARQSRPFVDAAVKDPHVIRNHGELRALDHIEANADRLAGSRSLEGFHGSFLERSRRTERDDPAFDETTALARAYEPQAELLGMRNPVREEEASITRRLEDGDITKEEAAKLRGDLTRETPERLQGWVGEVRQAAEKLGLPEPAYVLHQPDLRFRASDLTLGSTGKAMRGARRSNQALFRHGSATTHPRVLLQGVATNIKRKHQFKAVVETAAQHTLPWAREKSLGAIHKEIRARGLDPNEFRAMDMDAYRALRGLVANGPDIENDPALYNALKSSMVTLGDKSEEGIRTVGAEGAAGEKGRFSLLPSGAANELLDQAKPANKYLRIAGRLQGLQSGAILGLNPSWLLMQVTANTLAYTFGTKGGLADLAKASGLYKSLTPAERDMLEHVGGVGVLEGHTGQHLGSAAQSPIVQAARHMGDTKIGAALRWTNPMRLMFLADDAQNRAFRRAVLTNDVKRRAYRNLRRDAGRMAEAQARVENLLRLKPNETLLDQVRRVLQHPDELEKLATHANNVLGDYVRYTARERRYLKNFVMFYGFTRYALRTAFYTMPVHHPVMSAIALQLGQLHKDEVDDLLGGTGAPWAYSRIFFNRNGKLSSIDLGRISPVTSPLTETVQEGPHALAGLMSPMLQALQDQQADTVVNENRSFFVHGKPEENRNPDWPTRAKIVMGDVLSSAFPYRFGMALRTKGARQGDDSLLFDLKPIRYKTAESQARNQARMQRTPGWQQQLLQQIFPLFVPKPDYTRDTVQRLKGNPVGTAVTTDDKLSPADQREIDRLFNEQSREQSRPSPADQREIDRLFRQQGG